MWRFCGKTLGSTGTSRTFPPLPFMTWTKSIPPPATYTLRTRRSRSSARRSPHACANLRHSSATLLLSLGVHPKVVQEILGHSQISMTLDIYSHVLPSMHQDAMTRLNAAIAVEEPVKDELEDGQGEALQ